MANAILMALAPVFFVLALGYGAGKLRIIDNSRVDGFNALVMDFALPAALFVATASAPRSESIAQAPLFGILSLLMLLLYFAWYYAARAIWKVSRADAALQGLTIAFPNLAGIGLPILSAVLGADGTVPVAVALASGSILVSPLTLITLEMHDETKAASGQGTAARLLGALRSALLKPVVLAPLLGIIVSLSGLGLNSVIEASLALIGQATAGVALFLTGLILSAQSFRLDWKVLAATAVGDIVRPLLMAGLAFVLPIPSDVAKVAILLAAVPSGFFGILFAVSYRRDFATIGSMVIASTIFGILTMAVTIYLLFPA